MEDQHSENFTLQGPSAAQLSGTYCVGENDLTAKAHGQDFLSGLALISLDENNDSNESDPSIDIRKDTSQVMVFIYEDRLLRFIRSLVEERKTRKSPIFTPRTIASTRISYYEKKRIMSKLKALGDRYVGMQFKLHSMHKNKMKQEAKIDSMEVVSSIGSSPTFTPFPNLAVELRLKIWQLYLSNTQIVGLHSVSHCSSENGVKSRSTAWPLLQVNREARGETLRLLETKHHIGVGGLPIVADFSKDIFWLPSFSACPPWLKMACNLQETMTKDVGYEIPRLAISLDMWISNHHNIRQCVHRFALLELYLIIGCEDLCNELDCKFVSPRHPPSHFAEQLAGLVGGKRRLEFATWSELGSKVQQNIQERSQKLFESLKATHRGPHETYFSKPRNHIEFGASPH